MRSAKRGREKERGECEEDTNTTAEQPASPGPTPAIADLLERGVPFLARSSDSGVWGPARLVRRRRTVAEVEWLYCEDRHDLVPYALLRDPAAVR
jgi:hypothetical protein